MPPKDPQRSLIVPQSRNRSTLIYLDTLCMIVVYYYYHFASRGPFENATRYSPATSVFIELDESMKNTKCSLIVSVKR